MPGVPSAYKEVGLNGNSAVRQPKRLKVIGWGLYSEGIGPLRRISGIKVSRCSHMNLDGSRCKRKIQGRENCFGHEAWLFRRRKKGL